MGHSPRYSFSHVIRHSWDLVNQVTSTRLPVGANLISTRSFFFFIFLSPARICGAPRNFVFGRSTGSRLCAGNELIVVIARDPFTPISLPPRKQPTPAHCPPSR